MADMVVTASVAVVDIPQYMFMTKTTILLTITKATMFLLPVVAVAAVVHHLLLQMRKL